MDLYEHLLSHSKGGAMEAREAMEFCLRDRADDLE